VLRAPLLDITQPELAKAAGLGLSTIVDFEKCRRNSRGLPSTRCRKLWKPPEFDSLQRTEGARRSAADIMPVGPIVDLYLYPNVVTDTQTG
jgi:hypothetical protein